MPPLTTLTKLRSVPGSYLLISIYLSQEQKQRPVSGVTLLYSIVTYHVSKLVHGQLVAKLVGIRIVLLNVLPVGEPGNVLLQLLLRKVKTKSSHRKHNTTMISATENAIMNTTSLPEIVSIELASRLADTMYVTWNLQCCE